MMVSGCLNDSNCEGQHHVDEDAGEDEGAAEGVVLLVERLDLAVPVHLVAGGELVRGHRLAQLDGDVAQRRARGQVGDHRHLPLAVLVLDHAGAVLQLHLGPHLATGAGRAA